jgi:pyrroline-5-carboxylate reductase
VASLFAGTATALADAPTDLTALADAHTTPGGINEQFRTVLTDAGSSALVDRALSTILDRLRGTQPDAPKQEPQGDSP